MTRGSAWLAVCAALATFGCAGEGGAGTPPASRLGPVTLGAAPVQTTVTVPAALLAHRKGGGKVTLSLTGLSTDVQPGVLYRVQLGGADGPVLGHINFFNVATGGQASFSFDAGPALDRAGPGETLTVVLTPEGQVDQNARPVVGSIALVPGS